MFYILIMISPHWLSDTRSIFLETCKSDKFMLRTRLFSGFATLSGNISCIWKWVWKYLYKASRHKKAIKMTHKVCRSECPVLNAKRRFLVSYNFIWGLPSNYKNLQWLWCADWKFRHNVNWGHHEVCRMMPNSYPEWRKFQFAPSNHYRFFFLHILPPDECMQYFIDFYAGCGSIKPTPIAAHTF